MSQIRKLQRIAATREPAARKRSSSSNVAQPTQKYLRRSRIPVPVNNQRGLRRVVQAPQNQEFERASLTSVVTKCVSAMLPSIVGEVVAQLNIPQDNGDKTNPDMFYQVDMSTSTSMYPVADRNVSAAFADKNLSSALINDMLEEPGRDESFHDSDLALVKPLDLGIDPKVKAQIWADEFVEFGTLIGTMDASTYSMIEQGWIIVLKKVQQFAEFHSFSDWHTAFITFVGIYVQKHPNQSSALMKYMLAIQNLATSAGDAQALNYDRAFRQLRACHPARVPWDRLHPELYRGVFSKQLQGTCPTNSFRAQSKSQVFRFCYAYNSKLGCNKGSTCLFAHKCQRCREAHAQLSCSNLPKTFRHEDRMSENRYKTQGGQTSERWSFIQ
ncbi:hypothetical protein SNE40_019913 [Patella caerulea]|uniref:C3H1-type domain-containing protein n=1 Tax=Patella caerulea TaxID=87958 RepID=A0AAN8G6D3_PATCE